MHNSFFLTLLLRTDSLLIVYNHDIVKTYFSFGFCSDVNADKLARLVTACEQCSDASAATTAIATTATEPITASTPKITGQTGDSSSEIANRFSYTAAEATILPSLAPNPTDLDNLVDSATVDHEARNIADELPVMDKISTPNNDGLASGTHTVSGSISSINDSIRTEAMLPSTKVESMDWAGYPSPAVS